MKVSRSTSALSTGAAALLMMAGTVFAQTGTPATTPAAPTPAPAAAAPTATTTTVTTTTTTRAVRSSGIPQRDTLMKMMRPITIEFKEHRLEDVMRFIEEVTQADMEVFWQDDRNTAGLDKDTPITLRYDKGTALDLLIKVLDKAQSDSTGHGNSWQLDESGALQVGPKERLNKFKTVKLYSIADLLIELPDYANAPEFDLQSVLQSTGQGGGGGGGQSPFRDNQQQAPPRKPVEERAREIQDILVGLVEPEQWVDNGGDGASIRFFQGNFLVNAPDYIHRQIDGYPYWPAASTTMGTANGRRYVTLGVDTVTNKINGFTNQPVTGVVPGGNTTPPPVIPGGGG